MKLTITRDQSKGLMGGVNFELRAKVDLDPEEADLVKRYRADKEVLLQAESSVFGAKLTFDLKIEDLVKGQTFRCKDIGSILATEANVKEACENFKNYIEVMKSFGGQAVIDYA